MEIQVSAERVIGDTPERVYLYIADCVHHHPRFLPPAFSDFRVEEGGVGPGTILTYRLRAGGRTRAYRARIEEPEPGRVLEEHVDNGAVTSFTVDAAPGGSLVRIESRWQAAGAMRARLEGFLAPRMLRPIFEDELARLDAYAREQRAR
jgi:hypothetical protein